MQRLLSNNRALASALVAAVVLIGVVFAIAAATLWDPPRSIPSFTEQACEHPGYLELTRRGYFEPRSGQISLLPDQPAYMASGAGGWSHSGPWPYLQDVPIVFYGPGIVEAKGSVGTPATTADIAPTLAALLNGSFRSDDGQVLREVAGRGAAALKRPAPKLILTIVWDGGGWNTLDLHSESWPNLERMMDEGVTYTKAKVGSNPSVTPAVHTSLGTGVFPAEHGITGVPVRDEEGTVVDAFLQGQSSRFMQVPALAERWDEAHGNRAEIGMVGYEPWHLGMIGQGAERPGGDRDDAVWLDTDTNEWKTNPDHYNLPPSLPATEGLDTYVQELDATDGQVDGAWRDEAILDDPARAEETPAFIRYHTQAMLNMIEQEGYGRDGVADLVFTNYKQIDRVGHYFNMDSPYVRDSLEMTDAQLPIIFEGLDRIVGAGKWVVALTADHGQQPDDSAVDGFGISPREIEDDIRAEFGDVVRAVWPTEVFLYDDALEEEGVTVEEIARFLGRYTLSDNAQLGESFAGAGQFGLDDRLFEMAIPAAMLPEIDCGAVGASP